MENQEINKTKKTDLLKIDPRAIVVINGWNNRTDFGDLDELAEQIKACGVLNPLTVQLTDKNENGEQMYRLVDGERRYRAVMKLLEQGVEIPRVPAILATKSLTEEELLLQQIMRNEGKPFNEYEYGKAYSHLIDMGFTREEIAQKVGKKRWHVDVCLKHMERDTDIQNLLKEHKIEGSTVRKVYQANKDEKVAKQEIMEGLKAMEERVQEAKTKPQDTKGKEKPKKEKAKITLDDLNKANSKTLAVADTAIIKKGLSKLFEYYKKCNIPTTANVDLVEVLGRLKGDVNLTIDKALKDCYDSTNQEEKYRKAE